MPLLLPALCRTTLEKRYRPIRFEPPHILTPNPEPLEVQERRFLSSSLRLDPYHKPR